MPRSPCSPFSPLTPKNPGCPFEPVVPIKFKLQQDIKCHTTATLEARFSTSLLLFQYVYLVNPIIQWVLEVQADQEVLERLHKGLRR